MKTKLTITFNGNKDDMETFVFFNQSESSLGVAKARAREIVNHGFHYKEGAVNYFISPMYIHSVTWEDLQDA